MLAVQEGGQSCWFAQKRRVATPIGAPELGLGVSELREVQARSLPSIASRNSLADGEEGRGRGHYKGSEGQKRKKKEQEK